MSTIANPLDAAFVDNLNLPLQPPIGPGSSAQLSIVRVTGSLVEIHISGQTNQLYVLEQTPVLPLDPAAIWGPVSTNVANKGEIRIAVPVSAQSQMFYRATVPQ